MTQRFGLIGRGIGYSLSPILHTANFKALNLKATYELIDVERLAELLPIIESFSGLNVTVPYKESILSICDVLDPAVKEIGACNTIHRYRGKLYAYNTDWIGFIKLLNGTGVSLDAPLKTLLIGAGGAAKAVLFALRARTNFDVTIANRTIEKATQLTDQVLTLKAAERRLASFDIVINATSVGVKDEISPIDIHAIKEKSIFIDLNYQDHLKFLEDSKRLGAKTVNGLTMLVEQAAESFRIWTGLEPDTKQMYETMKQERKVNPC